MGRLLPINLYFEFWGNPLYVYFLLQYFILKFLSSEFLFFYFQSFSFSIFKVKCRFTLLTHNIIFWIIPTNTI